MLAITYVNPDGVGYVEFDTTKAYDLWVYLNEESFILQKEMVWRG